MWVSSPSELLCFLGDVPIFSSFFIRRFISRFNSMASHSQGRISKEDTLLTDGAREFLSHAVQHLLDEHGVNKIEAPPEVHALNGVAERAIL